MEIKSHRDKISTYAKAAGKKISEISRTHIQEIVTVAAVSAATVFYVKYSNNQGELDNLRPKLQKLMNEHQRIRDEYKDQEVLTIDKGLVQKMLDQDQLTYCSRPDRDYGFLVRAYRQRASSQELHGP